MHAWHVRPISHVGSGLKKGPDSILAYNFPQPRKQWVKIRTTYWSQCSRGHFISMPYKRWRTEFSPPNLVFVQMYNQLSCSECAWLDTFPHRWYWILIYCLVSSYLLLMMPSDKCPESYWWRVHIGSGNGLVPSGSKPLPEPMLTQIYVTIWHH